MFKKCFSFIVLFYHLRCGLGPSSTVGGKGKKRGQTTSWLALLADFFLLFPPMQTCNTQNIESVP